MVFPSYNSDGGRAIDRADFDDGKPYDGTVYLAGISESDEAKVVDALDRLSQADALINSAAELLSTVPRMADEWRESGKVWERLKEYRATVDKKLTELVAAR